MVTPTRYCYTCDACGLRSTECTSDLGTKWWSLPHRLPQPGSHNERYSGPWCPASFTRVPPLVELAAQDAYRRQQPAGYVLASRAPDQGAI